MKQYFKSLIIKTLISYLYIIFLFIINTQASEHIKFKNIKGKKETLTKILQSINSKKQVFISFNPSQTNSIYLTEESINNKEIAKSLNKLIKEWDLEVKIGTRNFFYLQSAQRFQLNGLLVEQGTKKIIANATVILDGKEKTRTDNHGNFYLKLKKGDYQLCFTDNNYKKKRIRISIGKQEYIKVEMQRIKIKKDVPVLKTEKRLSDTPIVSFYQYPLTSFKAPDTIPTISIYNKVREEVPSDSNKYAIKTNLLEWGFFTPNITIAGKISKKWTIELSAASHNKKLSSTNPLKLMLFESGIHYWTKERFNGGFIAITAQCATFDARDLKSSGIFKNMDNNRYQGNLYGFTLSYGYQWKLINRLNIEAVAGLGYAHIIYNKYSINNLNEKIKDGDYNYFGPTKITINFIYTLGR
ncbi:DUF3575 domain-containing protein [uncultured Bacteroides sp.]|uniref:DUF3575 domain-containing protein n=1 Tax=uncultured Bacteroides sp. TaxID=162156 RepID=UPI002AAC4B15|nr:DUF3575 domain-containing protein [uncultured Bacteroides sp.]